MHEHGAAGPDVVRPAQVVAHRPVVVLAVDVQQPDQLVPTRTYSRAALGDQLDVGAVHVGQELVPGGRAAEQRPVDERVDGDDLGTGGEHDRRATLMAADLDHGPVSGAGGLPQGEGLRAGQPARDRRGPFPYRNESGVRPSIDGHDSPRVSAR